MLKMILTVPLGFNARQFCNIATAMVRDAANDEDRRDYDYNLGDWLRTHYTCGDNVYSLGNNEFYVPFGYYSRRRDFDLYEVEADLVDLAHIAALKKLQGLCPQVEFHFENDGDGANAENPVENLMFADALDALLK